MKTFRLDPTVGDRSTAVVEEVDKLLREGKQVVVTVVDETKRYEDLRDGRIGRRELGSLRDLTTALVEARIVAGLTATDLGASGIAISPLPATSSASTTTLGRFRRFPTTPMVHMAKGGHKGAKRPLSNHLIA